MDNSSNPHLTITTKFQILQIFPIIIISFNQQETHCISEYSEDALEWFIRAENIITRFTTNKEKNRLLIKRILL